MTLFKNVNGNRTAMTAQEESAFEASRAPQPVSTEQINVEIDQLLADTDWTQIADTALTLQEKAQWDGYRSALRALDRTPRPRDLGFPVPPSDTKRSGR